MQFWASVCRRENEDEEADAQQAGQDQRDGIGAAERSCDGHCGCWRGRHNQFAIKSHMMIQQEGKERLSGEVDVLGLEQLTDCVQILGLSTAGHNSSSLPLRVILTV